MRGKQAPKRPVKPDYVFGSTVVAKLINYVMLDGKKTVATKLVNQALQDLAKRTGEDPVAALDKALENVKPKIEVRPRRVGGANYLVPTPVSGDRQISLALRWITQSIRASRGRKETWEVLSDELFAATHGEGNAIKKKQEMERTAEANKAFAQFSNPAAAAA